jgi:hypothetical protein
VTAIGWCWDVSSRGRCCQLSFCWRETRQACTDDDAVQAPRGATNGFYWLPERLVYLIRNTCKIKDKGEKCGMSVRVLSFSKGAVREGLLLAKNYFSTVALAIYSWSETIVKINT